ncbi:unnamed protein product [Pleuronectes platessa]|uniref:Uncharacterized protein n=1 Tax=Pleuronectes platessa TaxID=8262 RepID=A0A9N7UU09_PLEPL|nr:unnamed protein product [Pleuronectes platessa]
MTCVNSKHSTKQRVSTAQCSQCEGRLMEEKRSRTNVNHTTLRRLSGANMAAGGGGHHQDGGCRCEAALTLSDVVLNPSLTDRKDSSAEDRACWDTSRYLLSPLNPRPNPTDQQPSTYCLLKKGKFDNQQLAILMSECNSLAFHTVIAYRLDTGGTGGRVQALSNPWRESALADYKRPDWRCAELVILVKSRDWWTRVAVACVSMTVLREVSSPGRESDGLVLTLFTVDLAQDGGQLQVKAGGVEEEAK